MNLIKMISVFSIFLSLAACKMELETEPKSEATGQQFLIIDGSSKKLLSKYEFSDANRLLLTENYDDEEGLSKTTYYEYNASGQVTGSIEVDPVTGSRERYFSYEPTYGTGGELIQMNINVSDGGIITRSYEYGSAGQLISIQENNGDTMISGMQYE